MFLPECRPVLIGSLPLKDHRQALRLIFQHTPEIPLWPQLPKLPKEGMIRQFLTGFPGLVEDGERCWIDTGAADFPDQMALFYEDYLLFEQKKTLLASHAVLTADTAAGFFAFLQKLAEERRQPLTVKGQITGPVTTGIGVQDQHGRAIVYDDNLRDMLVKMIGMKAAWQVRQLQPFARKGIPPLLFVDEPGMVSFGSTGFSGVTRAMVTEAVAEVIDSIHRAGGLAGVHICANGDWDPVLSSAADIISFDAYSYFANLSLYQERLRAFLQRGGILAWGIVPTGDPVALEQATVGSLIRMWLEQLEQLSSLGVPVQQLRAQTLIAPSCGTGSLSLGQAEKVLRLTSELSRQVRDERQDRRRG